MIFFHVILVECVWEPVLALRNTSDNPVVYLKREYAVILNGTSCEELQFCLWECKGRGK